MAKFRPIYKSMWVDPDFSNYSAEGKLLFVYLCTNAYITESGLYQISIKTICNDTSLTLEQVTDILINKPLKNVFYDNENQYVLILKFKKYNLGGNPALIKKSIQGEYLRSQHISLWSKFFTEYPDYRNGTKPND